MAAGGSEYEADDQPSLSSQPSLASLPSLTFNPPHHNFFSNCLTTISGNTSYISSLTVAGKFLYSGSSDNEIRFWNRHSLDSDDHLDLYNNSISVGKGAVKSLIVLSDKMFSAHQDHKIRVWKISDENIDHHQKFNHLATLPTFSDRATKMLSPKHQVQIRRHKSCTWVHHVDTVSALALATDESLLYSVSWDRTLKIWRTRDFKCMESITSAHDDAINTVAVSSNGDVYTGSADHKIKIWRKIAGEKKHCLISTLEKHKSGINALALSSDGSVLYSGACDRSIVVWEKTEEEEGGMTVVGALRGHKESILCLIVVGDLVCSGSADKTIRVWRNVGRNYHSCLGILGGHRGPVKCLSGIVDHNNHNSIDDYTSFLLYSGSLDFDIKVWRLHVPTMLN
ncbi:Transducin/WD40 repeat-like superfamily protein [Euphorbia peplus]|nr:Transducin/WD40 repeat-like superfamily protein [Euphorbia peplus]